MLDIMPKKIEFGYSTHKLLWEKLLELKEKPVRWDLKEEYLDIYKSIYTTFSPNQETKQLIKETDMFSDDIVFPVKSQLNIIHTSLQKTFSNLFSKKEFVQYFISGSIIPELLWYNKLIKLRNSSQDKYELELVREIEKILHCVRKNEYDIDVYLYASVLDRKEIENRILDSLGTGVIPNNISIITTQKSIHVTLPFDVFISSDFLTEKNAKTLKWLVAKEEKITINFIHMFSDKTNPESIVSTFDFSIVQCYSRPDMLDKIFCLEESFNDINSRTLKGEITDVSRFVKYCQRGYTPDFDNLKIETPPNYSKVKKS